MEEIKDWLSKEFWLGKRWAVVNTEQSLTDQGRLKCYDDYRDAHEDCIRRSEREGCFRIKILGTILKRWNTDGPLKFPRQDREKVKAMVGRYPIRHFETMPGWEDELIAGNYYPMVWEKLIFPLIAVKQYVIVTRPGKRTSNFKEVSRANDFPGGIGALNKHIETWDRKGEIFMIGKFVDRPINYKAGELWDGTSTITFYTIEGDETGKIDECQFNVVHDPTSPVIRAFTLFVRYDASKPGLNFYDSMLKRVRPGDEPPYVDLHSYDFRGR